MDGERYLIWSNEHRAWWKPNRYGYSTLTHEAGTYSKEEAEGIISRANIGQSHTKGMPNEVMVLSPLGNLAKEQFDYVRGKTKPFKGRAWARFDDIKEGSMLEVAYYFSCMTKGEIKKVENDDFGLFIKCNDGQNHYLMAEADEEGDMPGFFVFNPVKKELVG